MKKLLLGCKDLNRRAQREMVNHLSPYLYAICCRYTPNKEDAKDLMQESLILIFNNIKQCTSNEEYSFKAWCKRIAINTALSKKRKKGFQMEVIKIVEMQQAVPPIVQSQLNVEDILKLLNFLPENQRLVFNLAIIDGYTHKEIAEILAIKESSSRTFLTRARASLQASLQKDWTVKKTNGI